MTDEHPTGWDTTTDPFNPQPLIFPVCPDCGEAWVYRRYLSLSTGSFQWAWGKPEKVPRGCRHKGGAHPDRPMAEGRGRLNAAS